MLGSGSESGSGSVRGRARARVRVRVRIRALNCSCARMGVHTGHREQDERRQTQGAKGEAKEAGAYTP